jgi:glycosyltransferase involved in cell wall biosynthesis
MAVYGTAASQLLGLPHLITMHGGLKQYKALRRRVALRWALRSSDYAVMVSRATQAQFAVNLGVNSTLFTVVPNGVPVQVGNSARVRAEFNISERERVILAVGVLERNKGHRILLEALAQLERSGFHTPWSLIVAGGGGGSEHQPLLDLVRAAGFAGRVHIVTNRNDVADLLALADVFVMPSLWEGLPMALLEAMVAGKAIVASATGGIPEAVIDGREGILVHPGEVDPLADALRLVLSDRALSSALAESAATRARKEFTVQVMADSYEALYANAWRKRQKKLLSA